MTISTAVTRQESFHRAVFLPSLLWSRSHSDFHAVTCSISMEGIGFRSATVPIPGERLTCSIGHVGTIDVRVTCAGLHAFTVKPAAGRQRNAALARALVELAERQADHPDQVQAFPRLLPRRTDLRVTLDDGSVLSGRLVEVSISGADVYLGVSIAAGARIRLGSTEAVVARSFGNGISAYFLSPLDRDAVNENLVL